ncbi:MAG: acyl-ACP thioesterase domain-containing protein [Lachnospiraceae bacterium]
MIYKHTFAIGLDDLNREKMIKNKAILKILEDVAGFHSDYVHYGINEIFGNGIAWALLDWEIEVKRRPQYGDVLGWKPGAERRGAVMYTGIFGYL